MIRRLLRRALAPAGLAVIGSDRLAAERAESDRLRAAVAHERRKVAGLKQKLAESEASREALRHRLAELAPGSDEGPPEALRQDLAQAQAALASARREANVYRKNLRWIWARYPGTESFWTKKLKTLDGGFEDRAQALKARLVDELASPGFSAADQRVTVVVTSCARHDLLVRTLESFFRMNTFPIEKVIVVEDGEQALADDRKALFAGRPIDWIDTAGRVGQIRAIDQAYAQVTTPYIFHTEDDWDFLAPGFIERSMAILQAEPLCLQVWLSGAPGPPPRGHPFEDEVRTTAGVRWRRVARGHAGVFHGFSFNPGLRRFRDYRVVGSSYAGVAEAGRGGGGMAEIQLSELYASVGYFAAALWEEDGKPFVRHTGRQRHVS